MLEKGILKAHKLVIVSYLSLLALLTLSIIWLNPPEKFPIALLLILYVGPLLIPLKGILSGKSKPHLYLSFMSLFYLAHAALMIFEKDVLWLGVIQFIICLSLFISCLLFTKRMSKR